jgi:superfamily I DNA/RNA helicase
MDELYLTYPEMRLATGYDQSFYSPSRFLREVPESLFECWEVNQAPRTFSSARHEDGEIPF